MTNDYSKKRPIKRIDISINMEKTGANIKHQIKARGYSIRDIMEITGVTTEQAIYKWYSGKSIPSIETQLILCNILDIDINELLVIDGEFGHLEKYSTYSCINCMFNEIERFIP